MGKKSGSGSGMKNPGHISESVSGIRDGKIWIRDPEWKNFGSEIRDKHPGSATLVVKKYNNAKTL
jgi:hypothetical protein